MQQSEQSGKDFFDLLSSPSGSSSVDVQNQVLAQRDASQALLDRAQKPRRPRADARRAERRGPDPDAAAKRARRDRLERARRRRRGPRPRTRSSRSATRWAPCTPATSSGPRSGKPEIKKVLKDEGVDGQPLPPGNFMPSNATDFLDQTTLVTKLNAISGQARDHRRHARPAARLDHDRRAPSSPPTRRRPSRATPGDRHRGDQTRGTATRPGSASTSRSAATSSPASSSR